MPRNRYTSVGSWEHEGKKVVGFLCFPACLLCVCVCVCIYIYIYIFFFFWGGSLSQAHLKLVHEHMFVYELGMGVVVLFT